MGFGSFSAGGGTVAEPMIVYRSDSSAAQSDLTNMQGRMQGFATTVRGAGIQMQMFGQAILGKVAGVVGAFMAFEDAFVGVTRTVDATEEEFALLERGLRDMALVIPQTAADLADIMKIAGQMGIRGVDNLLIFTETVARMGDVTDLATEQAAFGFARISTIMQIPIENVERMGSTIVDLGNKFATTEPLITDASVRASGAANTLGLSTAEMLGIVAQATVVMPRAQSAGSSLTRIWVEMADAAFTGGESLDRFANLMGLTTDETAEFIKTNPAEAFKAFIQGMGGAIDAGENWVEILGDIGLNQIRTRELVLNLAGNYPELARAIEVATAEWENNIALTEESEKRYATLSSQLQIFKNLIGDINITLGAALAPTITFIMERLKPFIDAFRTFAENNPKLMAALGGLIAALGALAFVIGTALIIAAIVPVLVLVSTTTVLVVLAFAALIALGAALIIFWPEVSAAMKEFWGNVQKFFTKEGFKARMDQLGEAIEEFGGILKEKFDEYFPIVRGFLKDFGIWMRNGLKDIGIIIRDNLKDFGVWIRNGLKDIGIAIRDNLKDFGVWIRNSLKQFGIDIRDKLKSTFMNVVDTAADFGRTILRVLKEFGMGIKNTLRETFDQIITPVIEAWKEIWETTKFWSKLWMNFWEMTWNFFVDVTQTAIDVIAEVIELAWPIIWSIVTHAFNVLREIFTTSWEIISFIVQIAWSRIWGIVTNAFNVLMGIFTFSWEAIALIVQTAWDIIIPIITFAIEFIQIHFTFWFETLKNIFQTQWDIILSIIKIVWTTIKNAVLIAIQLVSGIIRLVMALLRGDWDAAWDAVKDTVTRVWDLMRETVETQLNEVWFIIKAIWGFIKTETEEVWQAVEDTVLGALRAIRDVGAAIIDGFIGFLEIGINNILDGIADFVQKGKNMLDDLPFGNPFGDELNAAISTLRTGISIPTIMGEGALVMGPTLAMVGDKGPELVIPLDKLEGFGPGQQFYAPVYQTIVASEADDAFEIMKRIKT